MVKLGRHISEHIRVTAGAAAFIFFNVTRCIRGYLFFFFFKPLWSPVDVSWFRSKTLSRTFGLNSNLSSPTTLNLPAGNINIHHDKAPHPHALGTNDSICRRRFFWWGDVHTEVHFWWKGLSVTSVDRHRFNPSSLQKVKLDVMAFIPHSISAMITTLL